MFQKPTENPQYVEEGKYLKREDELTDISEIPAVQKGLYAPEKPTLMGKFKEGVSDSFSKISDKAGHLKENILPHGEVHTEEKKSLFEKLNDGLSSLRHGITEVLHGHEEQPLGERTENVSGKLGSIDYEVKLAQDLIQEAQEGTKRFGRKMSQSYDELKSQNEISGGNTITPNREGPSTLDKINDKYSQVAGKIVDAAENLKEKVLPSGNAAENTESNITERGEDSDSTLTFNEQREALGKSLEAPTHHINPSELKDFQEVKGGFNESVGHYKHDHRVEELGGQEEVTSKNPFDALNNAPEDNEEETEEASEKASEEPAKRAIGGDITNKVVEAQHDIDAKSIPEAIKEGISGVSGTLSDTLGHMADKLIHTLDTPVDKENFRQFA